VITILHLRGAGKVLWDVSEALVVQKYAVDLLVGLLVRRELHDNLLDLLFLLAVEDLLHSLVEVDQLECIVQDHDALGDQVEEFCVKEQTVMLPLDVLELVAHDDVHVELGDTCEHRDQQDEALLFRVKLKADQEKEEEAVDRDGVLQLVLLQVFEEDAADLKGDDSDSEGEAGTYLLEHEVALLDLQDRDAKEDDLERAGEVIVVLALSVQLSELNFEVESEEELEWDADREKDLDIENLLAVKRLVILRRDDERDESDQLAQCDREKQVRGDLVDVEDVGVLVMHLEEAVLVQVEGLRRLVLDQQVRVRVLAVVRDRRAAV